MKTVIEKPARSCRLSQGSPGSPRRILTLFVGREAFLYWIEPVTAGFGTAYRLEKFTDGEVYTVNLGGGPRNSNVCNCKGFQRWQYCKHVSASAALKHAGRL